MSLRSVIKPILLDSRRPTFHANCILLEAQVEQERFGAKWVSIDCIRSLNITWSKTILWKELGFEVLVATTIAPRQFPSKHHENFGWGTRANKYMKSQLQKCIRRSLVCKAIKTTYEFLIMDPVNCLRRLTIIAVEDALPLTGYTTLLWYMCAVGKGYMLQTVDVAWILAYVYDLCKCSHYEQFDYGLAEKQMKVSSKSLRLSSLENQEERNLCYSLAFRKAHGGMEGDMKMLQTACLVWATRYRTKSQDLIAALQRTSQEKFITFPAESFGRHDLLHQAIDFHCDKTIVSELQCKHDQFSCEEITNAIWHHSSCFTDKRLLCEEDYGQRNGNDSTQVVWKSIEKDFVNATLRRIAKL